ncbi:hypothetical protein FCH38_08625 [Agrobacterium tumefaciens]|nr:hypothetical protein [Agrobacterium sp. ICMP 6402]NTZ90748.1 hypothetical protein [Agrobacterium tumefaciens]
MSLVHNERTKLLANSIDRLSTACVAAGFIAPAVSLANGSGLSIAWGIVASTCIWLFTAFTLHLGARHVLGRLRP